MTRIINKTRLKLKQNTLRGNLHALVRFKLDTTDFIQRFLKDFHAQAHAGDILELGEQAELFKQGQDIRHKACGRAERADDGGLLEDLVVDALFLQQDCERLAADASSGNHHFERFRHALFVSLLLVIEMVKKSDEIQRNENFHFE